VDLVQRRIPLAAVARAEAGTPDIPD